MASLAHAVTSNLFVPQALRSQMQKQRSWWLLRRSYSTSQTRKTFMSNMLCSTPEASHHQAPRCVGAQFIFLCAQIGSPPPTQQEVLVKQMSTKQFPTSTLVSIMATLASAVSCLTVFKWTCSGELGDKKRINIKQDYITGLLCSHFSSALWSHVQFVINRSIKTHCTLSCLLLLRFGSSKKDPDSAALLLVCFHWLGFAITIHLFSFLIYFGLEVDRSLMLGGSHTTCIHYWPVKGKKLPKIQLKHISLWFLDCI